MLLVYFAGHLRIRHILFKTRLLSMLIQTFDRVIGGRHPEIIAVSLAFTLDDLTRSTRSTTDSSRSVDTETLVVSWSSVVAGTCTRPAVRYVGCI